MTVAARQPGEEFSILSAADEEKFLSNATLRALETLRREWGAGYEIGIGGLSLYAARPRVGGGEWITAEYPSKLAVLLAARPGGE